MITRTNANLFAFLHSRALGQKKDHKISKVSLMHIMVFSLYSDTEPWPCPFFSSVFLTIIPFGSFFFGISSSIFRFACWTRVLMWVCCCPLHFSSLLSHRNMNFLSGLSLLSYAEDEVCNNEIAQSNFQSTALMLILWLLSCGEGFCANAKASRCGKYRAADADLDPVVHCMLKLKPAIRIYQKICGWTQVHPKSALSLLRLCVCVCMYLCL